MKPSLCCVLLPNSALRGANFLKRNRLWFV